MIETIRNTIHKLIEQKTRLHMICFFILFPLTVAIIPIFVKFEVNDDGVGGNIISGLSLFIGFFFSLIFVISDRVQLKKEEIKRKSETNSEADRSQIAKLNAYIGFGRELVGLISTTVYISLVLIILLLLSHLQLVNNFWGFNSVIANIVQFINLYLGVILLYLIVHILKEMYDFFYGQLGDS